MTDREKVIKGLECRVADNPCKPPCEPMSCDYAEKVWMNDSEDFDGYFCDTRRLMADALELLKAQDAVEPYMDYDGQDVWRCGKCGNSLMHPSYHESDEDVKNHIRYCSHCGKAVKWD